MAEPITTDNLSAAVAQGLREAISDPSFWKAASEAMQQHAKSEAGGWLLGSVRALLSKLFLFLLAGMLIYSVGGWSALLAFFKAH